MGAVWFPPLPSSQRDLQSVPVWVRNSRSSQATPWFVPLVPMHKKMAPWWERHCSMTWSGSSRPLRDQYTEGPSQPDSLRVSHMPPTQQQHDQLKALRELYGHRVLPDELLAVRNVQLHECLIFSKDYAAGQQGEPKHLR